MTEGRPENAGYRLVGEAHLQVTNKTTEQAVVTNLPAEYIGVSPSSERTGVPDPRRANRGLDLFSLVDPAEPKGKLVLLSIPKPILAVLWYGSEITVNDAGGSFTDESHAFIEGLGIQLNHRNVDMDNLELFSAAAGGGTEHVKDTDWEEVNQQLGIIRPIPGGNMGASGTCYASGDHFAVTGTGVKMGGNSTIEARLQFSATNDLPDDTGQTGADVILDIRRALLISNQEVNLAGKEAVKVELEVVPQVPPTGNAVELLYPQFATS